MMEFFASINKVDVGKENALRVGSSSEFNDVNIKRKIY